MDAFPLASAGSITSEGQFGDDGESIVGSTDTVASHVLSSAPVSFQTRERYSLSAKDVFSESGNGVGVSYDNPHQSNLKAVLLDKQHPPEKEQRMDGGVDLDKKYRSDHKAPPEKSCCCCCPWWRC